ncbi:isochorismatase family protein|uniref:isochorismatase n=1 Tax=Dendrosporobacter quercicolus TaxID=146817 RepID=A0A1G9RPQ2_9FIRM|nr:isochorismatase family protein [Dendrosporobacter quercicolus]NSL49384.1 isochorismatase family protein [Dendrosporobacter quercicolus DSM 1736]SDM25268.1 bifunctional isochorismate lyase / aryl carrier protein [Dendrosporobacter quercicolus]
MSIPAILPYSMPLEADLPSNRAWWKAHSQRAVLLIHDMQQYFLSAYQPEASPVAELLENIRLLKTRCAELGIPVVYTAQPGAQQPEDHALLRDFWGPGLADEPEQAKIVDAIAPGENDTVLTKWRYSAFKRTKLRKFMQERGRDQLIICGVYAHIGCLLTAGDAFMQDVQTFFVGDAMADFSLAHHQMALKYAADNCAVITSTALLLDELKSSSPSAQKLAGEAEAPGLTLQQVRNQVAELLGETAADMKDSENLIDRGLDSIRMMSLVEKWRRVRADLTFVKLAKEPTIATWWRLLSAAR